MKNTIKKLFLITFLSLSISTGFGQVPQKMSYQSVIRNTNGDLVTNTLIGERISILKDSPTGQAVYIETMTNSTNENGLLSIEIGGGTPVTGTFAGINWAIGTYFVKTETDPNGGTNYSIIGTSQLMSVPYALYAENSKNLGKTTIILTDDITDAEAATKIAEESGPNTENIIITNTTVLTSVNLSSLTNLISIDVSLNQNLTSINCSGLTKVYNEIKISSNTLLSTINFNSLTFFPKTLTIVGNGLTSLNFPVVTKVVTGSVSDISSNPNLLSINFPALTSVGINANLKIAQNAQLTSFETPSLTTASYIYVDTNANLTTINFNSFVSGSLRFENNKLTNLSLPAMVTGNVQLSDANTTSVSIPLLTDNSTFALSNSLVTSLSLPSLKNNAGIGLFYNSILTTLSVPLLTTASDIQIAGNSSLVSLTFPSMTSIEYKIQVNSNNLLSSVSFPILTSINPQNTNYGFYFDLGMNSLPSSQINYLLNKLTMVNNNPNKTINLANQSTPAPPIGQGLIDKLFLINNGFTVITD